MPESAKTSASKRQILVWDAAVRVFHWLLVALIAFMWWSGEQRGNWLTYHFYAGYAVLTQGKSDHPDVDRAQAVA